MLITSLEDEQQKWSLLGNISNNTYSCRFPKTFSLKYTHYFYHVTSLLGNLLFNSSLRKLIGLTKACIISAYHLGKLAGLHQRKTSLANSTPQLITEICGLLL